MMRTKFPISALIFLLVSASTLGKEIPISNDYFHLRLCENPQKQHDCQSSVEELVPKCQKWDKIKECLRIGECPEELIASCKTEFEDTNNVQCTQVPISAEKIKSFKLSKTDNDGDDNSADLNKGTILTMSIVLMTCFILYFK